MVMILVLLKLQQPMKPSDVDVSAASPTRPVDDSTTDDITLAETLMKIKSTTSRPQYEIPAKDKGKGIMQEPEKLTSSRVDEEARLEREREEEASKAANIAEWDDVQAMMDADYKLATKLLAEEQGEISIEERSRLFVELMDKRKKHFAKLRGEEQRRKPPTKTQKKNIMSTYLKNIDGYKHTQLKNKRFKEIQMLFVQKVDDDDKEREDLNQCFEIVLDEEFIVHAILLGVKPAPIVGFQIHKAGRQGSYEIIRANGSTKTYTLFSQLIKEFDREDLENL
ncbi:hypothetical protein Tco_0352244 [Tanacetum coccineum]